MTVREAVASLKTLCHTCELFPKCVNNKPECYQAIELAISALEAQESSQNVTNGDFILRKAAIDAVGSMLRRKFGIGGDLAEITLSGLPSAQPNPNDYKTDHGYMWICPDCGLVVHSDFRKCPRCGMDRKRDLPLKEKCFSCEFCDRCDAIGYEQMKEDLKI